MAFTPKKKIKFMDTSFRDGFQSVFGARVRTKDFLPAIAASAEAGIDHFEFGGGARFQSLFFYCQESAFDMMDQVRRTVGPDINLQTLARGINVVGLSQQPKDIIELHAKLFKKHGTTTIRNFDALNDMDNLNYSGNCIHNNGLHHQITITLMGLPPGIKETGVHTSDFYMEKLDDILAKEIPFDSLVFKDASGTCPPHIVFDTIRKARKKLGKEHTIWFHTHDTAGLGTICIMAAIRAGVTGIDLCQSPVSGGTAQPDILSVWHSLRNSEYTLDIDFEKVLKAEQVFEDCMSKYMIPPEAKATSPMIVLSPMPGGALTANTMMMRDTNTLHLYPKVIREMAEVVAKGGYGTSVTPVSQFYFQQAFINVVQGRWKKITDGYGNMVLGYFGKTPRQPDQEIVEIAAKQLKKDQFSGDPLSVLEPGIEPAIEQLREHNLPVNEENIFITATCKNKGIDFLQGKAPLSIYFKSETPAAPRPTSEPPAASSSLKISMDRDLFDVKLENAVITITPKKEALKAALPADEPEALPTGDTVKAPIAGRVMRLHFKKGDIVKPEDVVLLLDAMQMENEIKTFFGGKIVKMFVHQDDFVKTGAPLFTVDTNEAPISEETTETGSAN